MNRILIFFALIASMVAFQACSQCPESSNTVGDEFFTVEYRTPGGVNYLDSIYDHSNIVVFVDTTGGVNPTYRLISPGYTNGKFGPFYYAKNFVDPTTNQPKIYQLIGRTYKYNYHIKKDTFGEDVFTVEFRYHGDECSTYWEILRLYKNGEKVGEGTEQANLSFTE